MRSNTVAKRFLGSTLQPLRVTAGASSQLSIMEWGLNSSMRNEFSDSSSAFTDATNIQAAALDSQSANVSSNSMVAESGWSDLCPPGDPPSAFPFRSAPDAEKDEA